MIPLGIMASAYVPGATWAAAVTALSPALWWRLGESSGTAYADSSGNGRTGTLTGSGQTQGVTSLIPSDATDGALRTAGAAKVTLADAAWMDAATYTVIATVKGTSKATDEYFCTRRNTSAPTFQLRSRGTTGYLTATFWDSTFAARDMDTTVDIKDGSAHLVVFSVGASVARAYVDGSDVASYSAAAWSAGDAPFEVAGRATGTQYWIGDVDEVVYLVGSALDATAVTDLHTAWSA